MAAATTSSKYGYGWLRGLPSRRYEKQQVEAGYPALASKWDLRGTGYLPPEIWDQGDTSSCTGHGTTAAIMFARAKAALPFVDLSRLFCYWNARVTENAQDQDGGAVVGDVIQASETFGDCPYSDLPTDPRLVTVAPLPSCYTDALKHKPLQVTRVWGKDSEGLAYHTKHCISEKGLPVVLGFVCYENWESDEVARTGVVPLPGRNENPVGGHCVLAVAYDDSVEAVWCRNSYGPKWGQSGYFQLPYAYVFDPDLADDFFAVELAA